MSNVGELAFVFLKIGTTTFGGPAVHVAVMEDEIVHRRKWLSREQFLDLWGATQLIPGPNSTELAIHIGYQRAGWRGLLVAGGCFILPAALIVGLLAYVYVRFRTLPALEGILYGVKPVVIVIVLQALWRLGRGLVRGPFLGMVGVLALALNLAGVHELVVLFGAGAVLAAARVRRRPAQPGPVSPPGGTLPGLLMPWPMLGVTVAGAVPASVGLWPLFAFFAKVGSVLFGSGYVLLAFIRADLVDRWGWLTEPQLLDAIAVGQITPGPLFTTATFIGYLLAGPAGAMTATVGIFLPAFVFVALSGPLVPRLRRSVTAGAFLDGLNVASLALLVAVTVHLARAAFTDFPSVALAAVCAVLLLRFRVHGSLLVCGGALVGMALRGLLS